MASEPRTTAEILERCAGSMHSVAFDFYAPAPNIAQAERRIAEVERICIEARRAVRWS